MELRVLRYFLAVAREETISGAAQALHVTQPTLSRQIRDLEEELGKTLFLRGKRRIALTEDGMFFRRRAQEIVELADKTASELRLAEPDICGDVWIGGGETEAMRVIARAAQRIRAVHPHMFFHVFSGNAEEVAERLDRGLVDFGVFVGSADMAKYDFIKLPVKDAWGLLMRKDSPLAAKAAIRAGDMSGLPLLCSRQPMVENELSGWMGADYEKLDIVATYNLLYNASLMVEEGVGYALCLDNIVRTTGETPLCFRPLEPRLEVDVNLVWKKYQVFSKAAAAFLAVLQRLAAA